jgi:beta-xylosidase
METHGWSHNWVSIHARRRRCFVRFLSRLLTGDLGRETFLVKVDWVDDWPVFNEGRNVGLLTKGRDVVPEAASSGSDSLVWKAALQDDALELGWYQKSECARARGRFRRLAETGKLTEIFSI